MILKQSTTYTRLFTMVQSADHISGLIGASPVVNISKAGGTGAAAANSPATEVDSTHNPGLYKIVLSILDTSTLGDLAFRCTAASGDPNTFIDQVQATIFPDLSLDANGNANISSNIKKNQPLLLPFVMRNSGTNMPQPGLTVTASRSLNGAGFAPCANPTATEVGSGEYVVNLLATDTNANTIMLLLTAAGAVSLYIPLITQP